MKIENRKKKADIVRLLLPIFIDPDIKDIEIDFNEIKNGQCLFGDISKREGLRSAMEWADEKGKSIRVVELVIDLGDQLSQGVKRMDEPMLLSGEYGMVRFEKYAAKVDLYDKITFILTEEARKLYPNQQNTSNMSAEDWLVIDPAIARVLFTIYPVSLVVVATKPRYGKAGSPVTTAVIKDASCIVSANVMYDPNAKVQII